MAMVYADLVIGAEGWSGGSRKVAVTWYLVGPGVGRNGVFCCCRASTVPTDLNSTAKIIMMPVAGPVSAAGDINGDGHDDLVIGAFGYPGGSY